MAKIAHHLKKPLPREPSLEEMVQELIAAGWSTWEEMVTVWLTPDGAAMLGTKQAWKVMARERAKRLDS